MVPSSPHPSSLAATGLFSVTVVLSFCKWQMTDKWTCTVYNLLRLTPFTQHYALDIWAVVGWVNRSFLPIAEQDFMAWKYHSLFMRSPAGGNVGCFHLLVIMKRTTIPNGVQVFVWTYFVFSLEKILGSGVGELQVKYMINFIKHAKLFSRVAVPFCIPRSVI